MPIEQSIAGPDQPVPDGFVRDVVERAWYLDRDPHDVWVWLCDPATFTDSQVPPWRVEFLDPVTGGGAGFDEGVLTTHHGPLLHFCGVIAEVRPGKYRDLHYTYGAYAGSLRLARPVRLEFWVTPAPSGGTHLRLRVTADVRRWLQRSWQWGNGVFWGRFGRWCERATA